MDIITHGLSGVAVGTVAAAYAGKGFKHKGTVILLSGFAAVLPDLDAFSLWSKFDASVGNLFHLQSGKQIYFSKLWYSHHGFLHSLLAAFLLTFMLWLIRYGLKASSYSLSGFWEHRKKDKVLLLSFFLAFIIHLLEDMPTPACVWGGVAFLWPSKSYWGGTGDIWWWNNYDIFLIVVLVIVMNLLVLCCSPWLKQKTGKVTFIVFAVGCMACLVQIKTRGFDFNYTGHEVDFALYEKKSKEIQREILGEKVYGYMVKFDRSVKVNF